MAMTDWIVASYRIDSRNGDIIKPYPQSGWTSVYFTPLMKTGTKIGKDENLLVAYSYPIDEREVAKVISASRETQKSLRLYIHQQQFDSVSTVLSKQTGLSLVPVERPMGPELEREIKATVADCAEPGQLDSSEVVDIKRFRLSKSPKKDMVMATDISNTHQRFKDYYWDDISTKRILFYLLISDGKLQSLRDRVSSVDGVPVEQQIKPLVRKKILRRHASNVEFQSAEIKELTQRLFAEEFCTEPNSKFQHKIDEFFSNHDAFVKTGESILKTFLNGEEYLPLDESPDSSEPYLRVYPNNRIVVNFLKDGLNTNKLIAAHLRILADKLENVADDDKQSKFVVLIAAPVIGNELVSYVEEHLPKVYLLDIVSFMLLDCRLSILTSTKRNSQKDLVADAFQQDSGVWDVNQGLNARFGTT